jgi:hypothetical protein
MFESGRRVVNCRARKEQMKNFAVYIIGLIIFVGALAVAADRLGAGEPWIGIGVVALIGLGIMSGIVKTRGR